VDHSRCVQHRVAFGELLQEREGFSEARHLDTTNGLAPAHDIAVSKPRKERRDDRPLPSSR
jgi:hypothetical protein